MSQITTPTFIIGLGGIGNLVARLVHERYLSTDTAIPDTVRLRSIDTANQVEYRLARALPEERFTKVGDFNASGVVQDIDLFPLVKRWWKYPQKAYALGFIDNGAGAKRPVGRLVFFQQFERIQAALEADFSGPRRVEVQRAMIEKGLGRVKLTPRVFIVGSLAGGTCAGTFIDVAFLVRRMLTTMGYEVAGASITGIFALPSVIHLASKDAGALPARQRQINAYASLRDLDFLMGGWNPADLRLAYPQPVGEFTPAQPLFNQVYLFSSTSQQGILFSQQEDVLQRVAHFIFGQVALGTGEETLQKIDNYRGGGLFDPSQRKAKDGMIAIYGAFGVEWLEVPHQQLVRSWCDRIAPDVAARVADFKWGETPLKNLDRELRSRLDGLHEPYRLVCDLAKMQVDDMSALPQAPDLQPFLAPLQGAKGKEEIREALRSFEAQLPALMQFAISLGRRLPGATEDAAWVLRTSSALMRDEGFRMGGARRLFEAAEAQLNAIADLPVESLASIDDVVRRCGGALFQRPDCGPAIAWVRARFLQQVRAALKAACGGKASSFSGKCRTVAHLLGELQHLVRDEVGGLAQGVNVNYQPPEENWLLDVKDIQAAAGNAEAVSRAVANEVSGRLAKVIESMGVEVAHEELGGFRPLFRDLMVSAIEREAMQHTGRPENAVERLKNRMLACQPMAQIITQPIELRRVMKEGLVAPPLKMVVTSMSGADKEKLERWAEEERRSSGDENAFMIAQTGDKLRDDALNMTLGWPLWLFSEVRECSEIFKNESRENSQLTDFAPVLGEAPGAAKHKIEPTPKEENDLLFSYAVILDKVKPASVNSIKFNDVNLFGNSEPAKSFQQAQDVFENQGMNLRFKEWLDKQKGTPGPFKVNSMDRVRNVQGQLNVADAIPDELRADLARYAKLVEDDVKGIVVL